MEIIDDKALLNQELERKKQKFQKKMDEMEAKQQALRLQAEKESEEQKVKLMEQLDKKSKDPLRLLKGFFGKNEQDIEREEREQKLKKGIDPNFLMNKYTTMRREGKLQEMEQKIHKWKLEQAEFELQQAYKQYLTLKVQDENKDLEELKKKELELV